MRRVTAALTLATLTAVVVLAADPQPRVEMVSPVRMGDLVVADFTTSGLPGDKLLQSMRSGLVSSIEVELAMLDEREKVVGGNQVSLQLGFDLWEEMFSVMTAGDEQRFRTLEDLQVYLAHPEWMPVMPTSHLEAGGRYRVRVGLRVHPIAPAEQDRVEGVIAGDSHPRREGLDQQEASVSLGRLIRFFYKDDDVDGVGEALSAWFTLEELNDEAH